MTQPPEPLPEISAEQVAEIREALRPLTTAKWAEDVANVLRAAGIKGERMHPRTCPLARYIRQVTGLPTEAGAYAAYMHVEGRRVARLAFTYAMEAFQRDFDKGLRFQDLVEKGGPV